MMTTKACHLQQAALATFDSHKNICSSHFGPASPPNLVVAYLSLGVKSLLLLHLLSLFNVSAIADLLLMRLPPPTAAQRPHCRTAYMEAFAPTSFLPSLALIS